MRPISCHALVFTTVVGVAVTLSSGCRSTSNNAPPSSASTTTSTNATEATKTTKSAKSTPTTENKSHEWVDPDRVPSPNIVRIGSVKWVTTDEVTAVSNNGRVLSGEWGIGVVEWNKDGHRRTLLAEGNRKPIFLDRGWYDARDQPVFFSDKHVHKFENGQLTSTPSPCLFSPSRPVVSNDRKVFACVVEKKVQNKEQTLTVNVYAPSTTSAGDYSVTGAFTTTARALVAVSNAGDVILRRQAALVAYSGASQKWRAACSGCAASVSAGIDDTSGTIVVRAGAADVLTTYALETGRTMGERSTAAWGHSSFPAGLVVVNGYVVVAVENDGRWKVVQIPLPLDDKPPLQGATLPAAPARLEVSRDGATLLVLGAHHGLNAFNLKRGEQLFGGTTRGPIEDLWLVDDARSVVVVRRKGRLERLDVGQRAVTASVAFEACSNESCAAANHPATKTLAVTTERNGIELFDAVTLQSKCSTTTGAADFLFAEPGPKGRFIATLANEDDGVSWLTAIAPDCGVVAEKKIEGIVWPAPQSTSVRVYLAHVDTARSAQPMMVESDLRLSPNGSAVAEAVASWADAKHPRGNNAAPAAAAFGYRSVAFVEGAADASEGDGAKTMGAIVRVEDTKTGIEVTTWRLWAAVVADRVALSPDNNVIAVTDRGSVLVRRTP